MLGRWIAVRCAIADPAWCQCAHRTAPVTARDDGTLAKIFELARQLQATRAVQTLAATVSDMGAGHRHQAMGLLGMS